MSLALLFFLVISPEKISKPNSYALHNFLMAWNILIILGRDIDKDQKRCRMQERQFLLSSLSTYLPWNWNLMQAITPILFEIIWWYLEWTYIRSSKSVTCKKDNSFMLFFHVISPERISKPNSCAHHNFWMVWNSLIICGRGIDKD